MNQTVTAARTIGAILVDSGKLQPADAERILHLQKEQGLRFGDAAIKLGLLTQQDLEQAFARQYNYPYLLKDEGTASAELVAAYEPFSPQVEALRALRSQLMLRWFTDEPDHKMLAICSAGHGEGRSHIVANLAVIFSQLGERTLLIDADMRKPRLHELFKADNKAGLSTILAARGGSESIQRIPDFVDLSLLTAGPTPPNPQELLGQPSFTQLLEAAADKFDIILVDTPPAIDYADTQMIAARTKAALIVARKHASSLVASRQVAENLAQVGVSLVGSVLTEF